MPKIKWKLDGGRFVMKIAVTYDNGAVFQHFGYTEAFKIYEVADNKLVKSEVVPTNGSGHGALAGFLKAHGVDALICGGIGGGAKTALAEASIEVYGGVSGSTDESVNLLLEGRLNYTTDTTCHHHDHEEGHSCHDHEEGRSCHEGGSCHH